MRPGRQIQPKPTSKGPQVAGSKDGCEQRTSKRKCVPTACMPCRKRKSKCDGTIPRCSTCIAVYKTDCVYEEGCSVTTVSRRPTLKRDHSSISDSTSSRSSADSLTDFRSRSSSRTINSSRSSQNLPGAADIIISYLRSIPEDDANNLLIKLRANDSSVKSLAESLQVMTLLPAGISGGESSQDSPTALIAGPTSVLSWSKVALDEGYMRHLVKLFFVWQNSFFGVVHEQLFWREFENGRNATRRKVNPEKCCSRLLVNAICAMGCHFTSRLPSNLMIGLKSVVQLGDLFLAETKRLLYDNEEPCLTTVQALVIMGMREGASGREGVAYSYAGRALTMAMELGLHLTERDMGSRNDISRSLDECDYTTSQELKNARKLTFWATFVYDCSFFITSNRLSHIPRTAIGIEKPALYPSESGFWTPYDDSTLESHGSERRSAAALQARSYPVDQRQFFHALTSLCELVSDTQSMFYAPQMRLTATRVVGRYEAYLAWKESLPAGLQLKLGEKNGGVAVQVWLLHIFYHAVVLHLFRPFIHLSFTDAQISEHSPRPLIFCLQSARSVLDLASHLCAGFLPGFPTIQTKTAGAGKPPLSTPYFPLPLLSSLIVDSFSLVLDHTTSSTTPPSFPTPAMSLSQTDFTILNILSSSHHIPIHLPPGRQPLAVSGFTAVPPTHNSSGPPSTSSTSTSPPRSPDVMGTTRATSSTPGASAPITSPASPTSPGYQPFPFSQVHSPSPSSFTQGHHRQHHHQPAMTATSNTTSNPFSSPLPFSHRRTALCALVAPLPPPGRIRLGSVPGGASSSAWQHRRWSGASGIAGEAGGHDGRMDLTHVLGRVEPEDELRRDGFEWAGGMRRGIAVGVS